METITITPQPFAFFELSESERNPQTIFQADVEGLAADLEAAVQHLLATSAKLQQGLDQAPGLAVPADWQQKVSAKILDAISIVKRLPTASSGPAASGNQDELNAWQRELQRCF